MHRDHILTGNRHRERSARLQRLELHEPLPILGNRGHSLTLKLHRDLLAILGGSPDRHIDALLQHRAVGNEAVRFDRSLSRATDGQRDE